MAELPPLTVVTKEGGPLSKVISRDGGKVKSDAGPCAMTRGAACPVEVNGNPANRLAELMERASPAQAIILGDLREGLPG